MTDNELAINKQETNKKLSRSDAPMDGNRLNPRKQGLSPGKKLICWAAAGGLIMLAGCSPASTSPAQLPAAAAAATNIQPASAGVPAAPGQSPGVVAEQPAGCQPPGDPAARPEFSSDGFVNIVWNDQPHYIFTSSDGLIYELLLPEETAAALGGPLALNNRRVSLEGRLGCAAVDQVEVIRLEIQSAQ